ncbi:hypothetical protein WJX73_000164 [Symbiochloris irregularis]|uniref:TLDc domain-containing protein n=1 Tax=Symbiochloris irregularis TaxID=706552 RepID=A0AAW1P5I9_9CHLO
MLSPNREDIEDRKPFGLSRLEGTALKQQYEANSTDIAAAVEGDSPEVAKFRSVLANTVLEEAALVEVFDADQDGWDKDAFHSCVKDRGAAVVVACTKGGSLLGGYNPFGWEGYGDQLDTRAAFLFTWPDGNLEKPAIKLPKVGGPGLAVIDDPDRGPKFGAEGLSIPLQPRDSPRAVQCRLGTFYHKMPDGSRSLFPEGSATELVQLKVYVAT